MIDIFYPYIENKAKWDELRYSLRSIEKFIKFDYRVVIVGDKPGWLKNIFHIPVQPIVKDEENCLRDTNNKLYIYLHHELSSEKFIRMNDDVYILNDITESQLSKYKSLSNYADIDWEKWLKKFPVWTNQLKNTLEILLKNGFSAWNTEVHVPELFERQRMISVFQKFEVIKNKLLPSSLYFNTIPFFKPEIQTKNHGDVAKFYGSNAINEYNYAPEDNIDVVCVNKLFLNHNNSGLSDKLKQYLINKFSKKSCYEK